MIARNVLVTGADGFVGRVLVQYLTEAGAAVRPIVRRHSPTAPQGCIAIDDITTFTGWKGLLADVDAVVHLAGIPHDASGRTTEDNYWRVNVLATEALGRATAAAGVRRFVFASSLKVLGEHSDQTPLRPFDTPNPSDSYARSKALAEQKLADLFDGGAVSLSVVRPPLVYGPGVKGNFLRMMSVIHRGVPLPLASVRNRRSLVSVWNLADLMSTLVAHHGQTQGTWHVSDGEDLSTPELLRRLGVHLGRPARLLPLPLSVLSGMACVVGRRDAFRRLSMSLQVDISETRTTLSWRPPLGVDESLARTAKWYRSACGGAPR